MPHTPGPWEFDGENEANQGFDIAMSDGGVLATAYYDVSRDDYSAAQAEANAMLIAAAPALLKRCQRLAKWLKENGNAIEIGTNEAVNPWDEFEGLRADILKATKHQ